jgi:transcriptional regulator GlxA family with amidase domain
MSRKKVGIYLFDDVEVLDFAGPYEVFSAAQLEDGTKPFEVITLSQNGGLISAANGLRVETEKTIQAAPQLDLLIIPGGKGATENELHKQDVISYIKQQHKKTEILASVCTGAFLLAEAGVLEGKEATTHKGSLDKLKEAYPQLNVQRNVKFVDEGEVLTAAGISAGIELSLHIVARLCGEETMRKTADYMEYDIQKRS